MNALQVVLLVCLASAISGLESTPKVWKEWESFKMTHKKAYKDHEEESSRMKIFAENLIEIAKHNFLYAIGQKSYSLKMNMFGDMLKEEVAQRLTGFRSNHHATRRHHAKPYLRQGATHHLPRSVDWRKEGAVTPIKDQGNCGSCWAFSTTGSIEGQQFLKTGELVSLSEQNLVDCAESNYGCGGGLMDLAFGDIMSMGGIQSEETYPYLGYDHYCKFNKSLIEAKIQGFVDIEEGDEDSLKEAVALVGPIAVAIDAGHSSFHYYDEGIYDEPDCSPEYLSHAVLAVGYGKTRSGTEYWIVKNSWGLDWGDDGYIKMIKNKNMCGIATAASYPVL